jgi:protoporphyrinogen IX oxidase
MDAAGRIRYAPSMKLDLALIWLHVSANLFWIGAIVAVAVVLAGGSTKERGAIAESIYLKVAVPAFMLSFLGGIARLSMDAGLYLKQPWMHAKLVAGLAAIGLHHVLGARAKRMARGEDVKPGPLRMLAAALAACAVAAAFFALFQIPGRSAP